MILVNQVKRLLRFFTFVVLAGLTLGSVPARAQSADDIVGTYTVQSPFNDDVARVKVTRMADGTYQGRIVWANHTKNPDGSVRTDTKNADKKLRSRKYYEIIMVWGLTYENGGWVGGKLYDPYSGKTFSVKFRPIKGSRNLKARYYKGIPAIGIDATWEEVKGER